MLGFLGGALALVISSFVHYIVGDAEVMILLWVSMGIAIPTSDILRCATARGRGSYPVQARRITSPAENK